jgi:cell division protein FtsB
MPELVVYGEDGKPETVSYHLLATLLLNEVQKEHRVSERLQGQVQAQAEQLAALQRDNEIQATRMAALEQQVAVLAKAAERAEKDRMVASAK